MPHRRLSGRGRARRPGRQAEQAQRTPSGYSGGLPPGQSRPPEVALAPGTEATAIGEWLDLVPSTGQVCPAGSGLLVTLPDTTRSLRFARQQPVCPRTEVHPLLPGQTGTQ